MSEILNYLTSNENPHLNLFQKRNDFEIIHPYINSKKISPNNIYYNHSLFNSEMNTNQNNNYCNNNHNNNFYNFNENIIRPSSYDYKKEKKYMNKSHEPDLEMMKLQLRCDLIGQKINQIQNQVQVCKETNSKDNKIILKKNRTYANFMENINFDNNKENIRNNYDKNYLKIPIPKNKEIKLNDGFRKRQIKNKNKMHNISYINKNINNNFLINNSHNTNYKINNNINNNYNFRQSFFYNSMNHQKKSLIDNYNKEKDDKIIMKKINLKQDVLNQKENNIVKTNNYISGYNIKYNQNFIKNKNDYNSKKINKKSEMIRKNILIQKSKSSNVTPRNKKSNFKYRGKTEINENLTIKNNSNNIAKYGSFDQFFLNDNNYSDNSYIKYISTIKNNFNNINYNNLDKIKHNSFNNNKIIQSNQNKQNNFIIQKGYNLNIINKSENNIHQKETYKTNLNNKKYQLIKNYSSKRKKGVNSSKCRQNINKYKKNHNNKKDDNKNNKTQINNNFKINNNSNYYNFNYNQNNSDKKWIDKIINIKNNKRNNKKLNNKVNKNKTQNEFIKDYIDENSKRDYLIFNNNYSNDDLVQTTEMFNSTNDNKINFDYF